MKIQIEQYKGQSIEYDDDADKFLCDINIEDKWKQTKRSSLKDVRKEIDAFIKLNANFKPFKAIFIDKYNGESFEVETVESIRTDGKFTVKGKYNNSHYDKKDMERCMVYDAEVVAAKKRLEDEIEAISKKNRALIKELSKRLVKADLSHFEIFTA